MLSFGVWVMINFVQRAPHAVRIRRIDSTPPIKQTISPPQELSELPETMISLNITNPTPPLEPPAPPKPIEPSRICVLTFGSKTDYFHMTEKNSKDYTHRHGYTYVDAMKELQDSPLNPSRSNTKAYQFKIVAMRWLLETDRCDWILWHDADALFFNFSKKLEDVFDSRYDIILSTGPTFNSHWARVVNSGHFLVQNTEFSKRFMRDAEHAMLHPCTDLVNTTNQTLLNGWLAVCDNKTQGWWLHDQGLLQHYLINSPPDYACHIKQVGFRDFNSLHPYFGEGDLIIHLLGARPKRQLMEPFVRFANFDDGTIPHNLVDSYALLKSKISEDHQVGMSYDHVNRECPR